MIKTSVRSDGSIRCVVSFGTSPSEISCTKQQFKDECDINKILKRYKKTGTVPTNGKSPIYGDFSNGLDYTELMNKVAKVGEVFDQLPFDFRKEMGFNPENMIKFVLDDKNYDRSVDLGLRAKDEAKEKVKADAVAAAAADQAAREKAAFAARVREVIGSGAEPTS